MAGQITDTISGRATGQAPLAAAIAPRRFDFFRRYSRESAAMVGLVIFLIFLFSAVFAPLVAPYGPLEQHISDSLVGPSRDYWLGTDKLGRDIFSRMVYGARISLFVGGSVVLLAGTFGSLIGLLAGYARGFADEALMRITDIFFAVPSLILAMAIAGALGPSLATALIAVAVVTWPVYARLVRGQVLVLREREFVQAAQVIGSSRNRILWRHLFPNTLAPLLVQASFDMGAIILIVAGLSFVGFGAQPPTPEWGVMISEGRNYITTHWWLTTVPALAMLFLVAAFNLIGDGLRDVLDPRLRK